MTFTAVVDTSALIEFLAGQRPDKRLVQRMFTVTGVAPELIDAEALHALRRMVHKGVLTADQAYTTVQHIKETPIARVGHRALMNRAWEMRETITTYDGLYVALAEQLGVPLVTCDAKLAGSNGHQVNIEVYPVS